MRPLVIILITAFTTYAIEPFYVQPLEDSTPMYDTLGDVQKYCDKSARLKVLKSDSSHYWIKDDGGIGGLVLREEVKRTTGYSYDFGDTIIYDHPTPFYPNSLYSKDTIKESLDPEMEELMRVLEELK